MIVCECCQTAAHSSFPQGPQVCNSQAASGMNNVIQLLFPVRGHPCLSVANVVCPPGQVCPKPLAALVPWAPWAPVASWPSWALRRWALLAPWAPWAPHLNLGRSTAPITGTPMALPVALVALRLGDPRASWAPHLFGGGSTAASTGPPLALLWHCLPAGSRNASTT